MDSNIRFQIEKHYNIKIARCVEGPRQMVAETYILDDDIGNQYFCKITLKPLFIPGIIKTLPVVAQMHAIGIDKIAYPIQGNSGLYFFEDKRLVVLYNYIASAPQGFDYNPYSLGKLIGEIHAVTAKIPKNLILEIPKETFEFKNLQLFKAQFEETLSSKSADAIIQELKKLLILHEAEVRYYMNKISTLSKLCQENPPKFVITHGDVATNLLVKSPDDLYLIDWDELRLAPAERDIWMQDEIPGFLEGYSSMRPDFVLNRNLRSFCILQYYFESILYKFAEILNPEFDTEYRMSWVKNLARGRMASWRLSKMEQILE